MAAVTLRLFTILLVVLLSAADVSAKKKLSTVEDMRYGVALYYYYQGDYLAALTELLIAKERGGIQGHGDNPEIMEGGFSLGFGLERHASGIFERLLKENRSKKSQDAAWFFMSKLRYLRNDWEGADEALTKVRKRPAEEIRAEVYAHQINLAIQQNDLEKAEQLFKKRKPSQDWLPYVYYNLGAAYARQGNFEKAIAHFEKLSFEQYPTDELRALYDKAMTSAGYAYLVTKQYQKAIDQFSRVRLTSAHSNRALLGYGWAAAELDEFEEALKPWSYLAKSSLADENSQEAQIAVPYAYEKLGSEGQALLHFELAEQNFLDELARLEGVITGMEGNQLLEALKIERSSGMDWLKNVRENQVSPQLGYLADLFSREDFQGMVQELRDLVGIREDFILWTDKLAFYTQLMTEREQGRNKKAEELAAKELSVSIKQMKAKRASLARRIEEIAANKDYFALANAEEKDLINRMKRSQFNVDALRATDPFIDESEEAVRRYHGVLLWNASESYSDRLWRVVKTLNLLDKTLATVTRNHEKVRYLIDNPEDLVPLKNRLLDVEQRLSAMLVRVDSVIGKTQDDLRLRTTNVLLEQRKRLNHYIAQSRLSQARLYDKSLQADLQQAIENVNAYEEQRAENLKEKVQGNAQEETKSDGEGRIELDEKADAEEVTPREPTQENQQTEVTE